MGFNHWPELFIILVLALIVFGPSRLPEVGSSVGKALREFRRATSEIEDAVMHHGADVEDEEEPGFPHIPPAPDVTPAESIAPTIDTLAMRREARRARQAEAAVSAAASSPEEKTDTPS